jgi:hypothetical protein
MQCYWSDLDGLHIDNAPTSCPVATHLWGYDGAKNWVRIRIEDDCFVAVHLTERTGDDLSDSSNPTQQVVNFVRQSHKAWSASEKQVGQANLNGVPDMVEVVEVVGRLPLTFVSVVLAQ